MHARRVSACPAGGTGHRQGPGPECPGSAGTASAGREHLAAAPRGGGGAAACERGPAPAEQPRPLGAPASSGLGQGHHVTPGPAHRPPVIRFLLHFIGLGCTWCQTLSWVLGRGASALAGPPSYQRRPLWLPHRAVRKVSGSRGWRVPPLSVSRPWPVACVLTPAPGPATAPAGHLGCQHGRLSSRHCHPGLLAQPVKPLLSAAAPAARFPGGFFVGVG